ncbi:MAG: flagellar hook assembly protein FlgD [Parvibaculaceae bacterium]
MEIPATSSATSQTSATQAATKRASLDYDAFLKLLIAQMQRQDPTNPTDPAQYMSQLASFSTVEQAIKTNSKLDSLLSASALSQIDGLIGRTATAIDDKGQTITGKITALTILPAGNVATLDSGVQLLLGAGVTIS